MAVLREVFAEAGGADVRTLLNSGNVVFTASEPVDVAALERRVAAETGVSTSILVLDAAGLRRIVAAMPPSFPEHVDESRLVIAFMSSVPSDAAIPPGLEPELIVIGRDAVYQWLPDGVSKTQLKPAFWRQFPPETTARNLRTVKKLLELVDGP